MTGHNHYPDCTCGWCSGGGGGAGTSPYDFVPYWPAQRATLFSYTNPNAHCPVCGAPVFFYRSPYDGRVFFDELGPPWPKHGCTDIPRVPLRTVEPAQVGNPRWNGAGWEPVRISRISRERDWAVLKINRCGRSGYILRAVPWREGLQVGTPAFIKPLDVLGMGYISVLVPKAGDWFPHEDVLVHRTFSASTPKTLVDACRGDADSALEIAYATYRSWPVRSQIPKHNKYLQFVTPNKGKYDRYVDLRLARRWLKRAAELGSREAIAALEAEPEFRGVSD